MSDEWGPWIEHDGKGCPLSDGVLCHRVFDRPACGDKLSCRGALEDISTIQSAREEDAWNWSRNRTRVIRYRIRKPRGLTILEELLQSLPVPEREGADA